MKYSIIATLVLLTSPAWASDVTRWEKLNETCVYGLPDKHPDHEQICARAEALRKRLLARGYCTYGHGVVGRAGKGHCYKR